MLLTQIIDSRNKVVKYLAIEVSGDVQDAMNRLEKLEAERKELKSIVSRCFCIMYECALDSDSLLIKEIGDMGAILSDIDP